MNRIRSFAILGILTLVLGSILVFPTTPVQAATASSNSIAWTDGTRAAQVIFYRGPASLVLHDVKCDAHSVYVQYQINGGSMTRRNNGGGCGTSLTIPLSGTFNIRYRPCVDIQLGSDVCGNWVNDHS